ncbi:MAG: M48 family metallopeptidase [Oscillospiraceae bacterium]|nr:M48 family metallopeptidase [Oscillospiraceae bacterium]
MQATERRIALRDMEIAYTLERKPVKNINLRVRRDGTVAVSANRAVPVAVIEGFLRDKASFIEKALARVHALAAHTRERGYEDGEIFYCLGDPLRLRVLRGEKNDCYRAGAALILLAKSPEDPALRKRLVFRWSDELCREVFGEVSARIYRLMRPYGVEPPELRLREMKSRWGSCQPRQGVITLNRRLIESPMACIEYVVLHEYVHLLHPDHSKRFYAVLAAHMPDWKARKAMLDSRAYASQNEAFTE